MHLKILKKSLISRLQEKWMEKTNSQKCKWSLNAKQWVIDAFESVIFPMKYVNLSDGNHMWWWIASGRNANIKNTSTTTNTECFKSNTAPSNRNFKSRRRIQNTTLETIHCIVQNNLRENIQQFAQISINMSMTFASLYNSNP